MSMNFITVYVYGPNRFIQLPNLWTQHSGLSFVDLSLSRKNIPVHERVLRVGLTIGEGSGIQVITQTSSTSCNGVC